jgi:hypothetical protein
MVVVVGDESSSIENFPDIVVIENAYIVDSKFLCSDIPSIISYCKHESFTSLKDSKFSGDNSVLTRVGTFRTFRSNFCMGMEITFKES